MAWVASNQKMGFEGQFFIGAPGSTGATQITNCTDVTISYDMETGKTTVRGDGSAPPIETGDVTIRKISSVEITMINDVNDTALQTILTAVAAGARLAVRMKDNSAGKGVDADFNVKAEHGEPLNGEQTYKITFGPPSRSARTPQMYV